ncbi:MAG: HD-GYP domain-containing protein [Desulfarculus sp.]|uniref:Metal-dependent phosphohydrolase HD sub domain protein n=1 Tax=Pseudodesulfovibrio aespoeensis (strain ATCC 700646 / DSM 10631 / Aspo-2) TaxID=643562 RepID=E6VXS5_PSEA9|nr:MULTISPECIES: HD-GYP domain-containing protein [Pseudodesulfovibrio]ADU61533.1 metal-dependent phosphohydrolase HD sub domain protein [Pseudodesulfovibrio aespoeensis Aspo-2]MBV1737505.1 HD-GYP domain-containing protein [Desulfarculus sp.]MCG2733703.1 HD-GYP domain-containing protein [Pseudodesulfovibrio aespoeensis]
MRKGQDRLIGLIREIAAGRYSDEIMELTRPGYPAEIRELAEAVGLMMVGIEAREFHLEQLTETIRRNSLNTVTAVVNALGARDAYTEGHGERVSVYVERLARRLGLDNDEVERIRIAGVLHDIGKIGFSDLIFSNEDTQMSEDMLLEIRSHPQWSYDILKNLDFLGPSLEYVYAHHERLDGRGYPRGLMADEIPLGARVLAVADCFDAMTTDRPYQRGKTPQEALAILGSLAGNALDPAVVDVFIVEIEDNGMVG